MDVVRSIRDLTDKIKSQASYMDSIDYRTGAELAWQLGHPEDRELIEALAEFAEAITRPLEKRIEELERKLAGGPPILQ